MSRRFIAAAAQLGPIARDEPRESVVARMLALMTEAKASACELIVFPEMALTTFFPRELIEDVHQVNNYFEASMPSEVTRPLFDAAKSTGIGFYLGYCEKIHGCKAAHHLGYNSAIYDPALKLQHLEPWYFVDGDLGFPAFDMLGGKLGMLICNDRRWPEAWRMLGLKGVELVCLGYNSPAQLPDNPSQNPYRKMHHLLPMQSAAYQNGCWIIATAKAGAEEGCDMMGNSCVISPCGEVVAQSSGLGDELLTYTIDLDMTIEYKRFFDFDTYRRPECYADICKTD